MPVFDIVVVGSGGGLDETNLSGYVCGLVFMPHIFFTHSVCHVNHRYLVKPCNTSWDDGIVALEAGASRPLHARLLILTRSHLKGPGMVHSGKS